MSVAAAIRSMIAAGLTIEQALIAVEAMEQAKGTRSAAAERQRRYRERQKAGAVTSRDVTSVTSVTSVTPEVPPIKETSPTPPKENYPLSSEPTVLRCGSARKHEWPADFCEQLWAIYPRKTEKKAGIEALTRLHRADRLAWTDLIGGVEALADSDPQFVPALGRWLRGERWKDERPPARPPPFREAKNNRSLIDGLDEIQRRFPDVPEPGYPRLAG
jgi:hypothetical protein